MKKVKLSLDTVVDTIKEFYNEKDWHFLTLNGVALVDGKLEVQWIFSKYETQDEVIVYYCEIDYNDTVPSIVEVIPSAIISQRELVDMFDIEVEESEKGLYLDEDSMQAPLSCGLGN